MRRVLYVSGTRADYGPARRLLHHLHEDDAIELGVLVTGMHLDPVHGETWKEIEADGLPIAEKVGGRTSGDGNVGMAASIGTYLHGISKAVGRIRPDVILVLGDRGEQLAGAVAGATQNIPVVHLCGGALSGSIDDSIRHAITKFAHIHLVGFEEHAERVIQMGEDPANVQVVGLPGGDLRPDVTMNKEEVLSYCGIEGDYILVIQHPVTQSSDKAEDEIVETLEALRNRSESVLLANPNDDPGGRAVLKKMEAYAGDGPFQVLPPPSSRETFASVMAHASVLVGNSSSALVEAMSVGLPVVNVGPRQRGREHLACWITVEHDRREIARAVETATADATYLTRLRSHQVRMTECPTEQLVVDRIKDLDLDIARSPKLFHHVSEWTDSLPAA